MAQRPGLPAVTAVVNHDGTAVVTVDGVDHRIVTGGPDDARSEAVGYIVATVATRAGGPVPVYLVDEGRETQVQVHPDGWVEDLVQDGGSAPRHRHDGADNGADNGADESADAAMRAPTMVSVPWAPEPPQATPPPVPVPPAPLFERPAPTQASSPVPTTPEPATGPIPAASPAGAPAFGEPADHLAPRPDPTRTWAPAARPSAPPASPSPAPQAVRPPASVWSPGSPGPAVVYPSPHAAPAPAPPPPPTLEDLLASRPGPKVGPAESGWRAALRRMTGGMIKLPPGSAELAHRRAIQAVQRSLNGPKTIAVINTKGGGGKTTATYCLAATFGVHRGGYVLAWDDNETRGTLAWRAAQSRHSNTAVTLLRDLGRFTDSRSARVGDLDNYVRGQGDAQFDVLASDEDAASAASIDAAAFAALHRSLSRFYRIMIVDTGNNIKATNWQAAVDAADQVVIVSSIREDTAGGAAWTLDSLMESGHADKVAAAVTVLSAPSKVADTALADRFEDHFRRRTRAVLRVPYDPALVGGGPISIDRLSPATREAWLQVAATIADNL